MKIELRLLKHQEMPMIIPFIQTLNPNLSDKQIEDRLQEMIVQGYQCLGAFQNLALVGIAGIWIRTHFWCGRMIEPDNVCVAPSLRSQGIGEKMMEWIYDYGREMACDVTDLNCYADNHAAQKFWANEGYKIMGFHYQKSLN